MKYIFSPVVAIAALFGCLALGTMIAGNSLYVWMHMAGLLIVIGFTGFMLLSIYGREAMDFVMAGIRAMFMRPQPNRDFLQISKAGRRLAYIGGVLASLNAVMLLLATWRDGEEERLERLAPLLAVWLYAIVLGEVVFGFLIKIFGATHHEA